MEEAFGVRVQEHPVGPSFGLGEDARHSITLNLDDTAKGWRGQYFTTYDETTSPNLLTPYHNS